MRPVRLEVEGFTVFRERAVVDFEDVDLFALTGPTGSGKTSVIDAVTFALYGSVPRLDERSVAPVIAQNGLEARVRLDFTVGDEAYVAVRVVRPTRAGGATTKEARLETGAGATLAGDAKSMTAEVTRLLGLDFKQFTTCVSLPQGDFARFLHAEPRHRQDLLVRLLDLELYGRVGQAARERAKLDDDRAAIATGRLDALAFATDDALAAATARLGELAALRERIDAAEPELVRLQGEAEASARDAEAASTSATALAAIVVPEGVGALAEEMVAAVAARAAAVDAEAEAESALDDATAALAALPGRGGLEAVRRDHDEAARLRTQAAKGEPAVTAATEEVTIANRAVEAARLADREAEAALHQARTDHLAHALAADVVVGQPCPVCRREVTEPATPAPADVTAAEQARNAAAEHLDEARQAAAAATAERVRMEAKLATVREQLAAVDARLAEAPTDDELTAALAAVADAEQQVAAAQAAATAARKARAVADQRRERGTAAVEVARRAFDAARDRVATLAPPSPARDDLAADWEVLAVWAGERRPELLDLSERHRQVAFAAAARVADGWAALVDACRAAGVEPGDRPRDAVVDALARAAADERRIADGLTEAARLRAEAGDAVGRAQVARALAGHLRSDGFERWLLDEVQRELVDGATILLRDLSAGAYSLTLDDKSRAFAVVDHVNADSVRPARTLSGGETFLASLALALALADQVAASAPNGAGVGAPAGKGAARLETILLDEGFGTLDADTLDVVAAALEELGARGRMVGIVTHVRELAERLPVRYELRKVGGAATIERIDG